MNSVRVEILNPKAKQLLQNLADLKLISIEESNDSVFVKAVQNIRGRVKGTPPSLEEITKEVEQVRSKRYGKKGN
jgi:hypothetical protein